MQFELHNVSLELVQRLQCAGGGQGVGTNQEPQWERAYTLWDETAELVLRDAARAELGSVLFTRLDDGRWAGILNVRMTPGHEHWQQLLLCHAIVYLVLSGVPERYGLFALTVKSPAAQTQDALGSDLVDVGFAKADAPSALKALAAKHVCTTYQVPRQFWRATQEGVARALECVADCAQRRYRNGAIADPKLGWLARQNLAPSLQALATLYRKGHHFAS